MHDPEKEFSFKNLFVPFTTLKAIRWIIFSGLVVFSNSLFNGFVGDDFDQIINNPVIHSLTNIPNLFTQGTFYDQSGIGNNYFRPMLSLAFTLIYTIFGANPFWYHVLQLSVHISNAVFIFLILSYFFKKPISFFLSLLFLVHPLNTEAVVYISAMEENLFLFFGLIAFYLTIENKKKLVQTIIIPVLLFLSLLSKETGIVFLFIIPLFLAFFNSKLLKKSLIAGIIVFVFYSFLRFGVAHIGIANSIPIVPMQVLPFLQRVISVPQIIYFYLSTFFIPINLVMYQTWIVSYVSLNGFYLPLVLDVVFLICLLVIGLWLRRMNKNLFNVFLFFSFWFVLGISILLQIVPLDETVSDRWFYFPMLGLLGLGGVILEYLFDNRKINLRILTAVGIVLIAIFSARVIARNTNWNNNTTLLAHDSLSNKDSYQIQSGLGTVYESKGDYSKAEKFYTTATELFPSHITYSSLGGFYLRTNKPKKAVIALSSALRYYNNDPFFWVYLGIANYNTGNKQAAISDVKKAYTMQQNESILTVLETMQKGDPITLQL